MMLKPETPESQLLVDWVEGGKTALSFAVLLPLHRRAAVSRRHQDAWSMPRHKYSQICKSLQGLHIGGESSALRMRV